MINNQRKLNSKSLDFPIILNPTNFTPLSKTPWAGTELASGIKRNFTQSAIDRIGESWEFSCSEDFPSVLKEDSACKLSDLILTDSAAGISKELSQGTTRLPEILLKLINAAVPLSLQIHPHNGHTSLNVNECGKPETWLILDAKPGAGIYLGFSRKFSLGELKDHLERSTFDPNWLQFVPVKRGDFFEIGAGVCHAIGPDIVILEPQHVIPGKNGKTWRLWDWNRKYNDRGEQDDINGKPRLLNIRESLTLFAPEDQVGERFVQGLRRYPQVCNTSGSVVSTFPANPYYQVFFGTTFNHNFFEFTPDCNYGIFTLLKGSGILKSALNTTIQSMNFGETAFLPHACLPLFFESTSEHSEWTLVVPAKNEEKPENRNCLKL